ncbi:hypothetical protein PG991_014715 [Apiospora marii]|uniref:Heterokaryon incompatibility domain-containing protein n=1 Tax=Apiospora marii TaxID=335849 RepID=A0ABR1R4C2_9PEZI
MSQTEATGTTPENPPSATGNITHSTLPIGILELLFQNLYLRFVRATPDRRSSAAKEWAMTWEEVLEEADSCRHEGNFVDADCSYANTLQMLQALPTDFGALVKIHSKRGAVWVQLGRYEQAETYMSEVKSCLGTLQSSGHIGDEDAEFLENYLSRWLAMASMRLGKYSQVEEQLRGSWAAALTFTRSRDKAEHMFESRAILALTKAELGHFRSAELDLQVTRRWLLDGNAFMNAAGSQDTTERGPGVENWLAMLDFTEARVHQLAGRPSKALALSESATDDLKRLFGATHVYVLESSIHTALLLAHNGQLSSAESLCSRTLVSISRSLGPNHPITMFATAVMVEIRIRQGSYNNAVIMADELCTHCEDVMGPEDPSTLEAMSKYTKALIEVGRYRDAVSTLVKVCNVALRVVSSHRTRPALARYFSELASALSHQLEIGKAKALIQMTIRWQMTKFGSGSYESSTKLNQPLHQKDVWQLITALTSSENGLQYPDLVYSLETYAIILSRDTQANIEKASAIMESVYGFRNECAELCKDTKSTSKACYNLAALYRSSDRVKKSRKLFMEIEGFCKSDARHPDVFAARREFMLTDDQLEPFPELLTEMSHIAERQKLLLGKHHPETLRTLLVILGVKLIFKDQSADTTCRELLTGLRDPHARDQRLAESLRTEEKVAELYYRMGNMEKSHEILQAIVDYTSKADTGKRMNLGLGAFHDSVSKKLGLISVGASAKGIEKGGLSQERATEFAYRRLRDRRDCIRVLDILPGTGDQPIQCSLTEVKLSDKPQFMALSWIWGDWTSPATIHVDDSKILMTRNCAAAISHVRDTRAPKRIWIDYVCVDQNNVYEKDDVASLLERLFRTAEKTIIWLGPQAQKPQSSTLPLGREQVVDILEREWWTHVGVIQELCFANDPVLLIGHEEINWEDFSAAFDEYFDDIPPPRSNRLDTLLQQLKTVIDGGAAEFPLDSNFLRNCRNLIEMRRRAQSGHREGLLELLVRFQSYNSITERDKVFSLLNLARDDCGVKPDYEHSSANPDKEAQIYCHAALCIIKSYQHIGILGHLDRSGNDRYKLDLPSWVPHWNRQSDEMRGHPDEIMDESLREMVYADGGYGTVHCAARRHLTTQEIDRLEIPGMAPGAINLPVVEHDHLVEVIDALPRPGIMASLQDDLRSAKELQDEFEKGKAEGVLLLGKMVGKLVRIMRSWKALAVFVARESGNPDWFQGFCTTLSRGRETSSLAQLKEDWKRVFEPETGLRSFVASGAARLFVSYVNSGSDEDRDTRLGLDLITGVLAVAFSQLTAAFSPTFGLRLARTGRGIWPWSPVSLGWATASRCWRRGHPLLAGQHLHFFRAIQ